MISVGAIVHCITENCLRAAKVTMERGYDDGTWHIPGTGSLLGPDRPNIPGLEDWGNIGRYFGERESWSNAICPACVERAKFEGQRPQTLLERVELLEQKMKETK